MRECGLHSRKDTGFQDVYITNGTGVFFGRYRQAIEPDGWSPQIFHCEQVYSYIELKNMEDFHF
jgi:hypothetical protein